MFHLFTCAKRMDFLKNGVSLRAVHFHNCPQLFQKFKVTEKCFKTSVATKRLAYNSHTSTVGRRNNTKTGSSSYLHKSQSKSLVSLHDSVRTFISLTKMPWNRNEALSRSQLTRKITNKYFENLIITASERVSLSLVLLCAKAKRISVPQVQCASTVQLSAIRCHIASLD